MDANNWDCGWDFGQVEKYVSDRGFGFVSHTFKNSPKKPAFFHIRTIRKSSSKLAAELAVKSPISKLLFWYKYNNTEKGSEVVEILSIEEIKNDDRLLDSISINLLREIFSNIKVENSPNLDRAIIELLGKSEYNLLLTQREELIERRNFEKKKRLEERQLALQESLKLEAHRIEAERKKMEASLHFGVSNEKIGNRSNSGLEGLELEEFNQLVEEVRAKGFSQSREISNYIINNRLGDKYQHISGVLTMENNGETWNFNGGFPPKIYALLCNELGVGSRRSSARVKSFTSFYDQKKNY